MLRSVRVLARAPAAWRVSPLSRGFATAPPPPPPPDSPSSSGGTVARGPLSWASLALLVATGGGLVAYYNTQREARRTQTTTSVTSTGKALLGGPWALVDDKGKLFSSEDLKGGYSVLYFGFCKCPDICPTELVKVGKVMDLLAKDTGLPQVTPVFITLDTNRDTIAQIRAYKQDFHPSIKMLTGTPGQVGAAAKAFRVYFSEVDRDDEDDDDYVIDHSIVLYFMDKSGEFVQFYTQLKPAEEIAKDMAAVMRAADASA